MAITLKQTNTGNIGLTGSASQAIPLPGSYTTSAGDCILLAIGIQGGSETLTFSGCGATWAVVAQTSNAQAAYTLLVVGYGCTAGGTSITIGAQGGNTGDVIISVWGGLLSGSNPVSASQSATSGASNVTTLTTPSLSYSAGQLVVGMGVRNGGGAPTFGAWSNGATNTVVFTTTDLKGVRLDYQLPVTNASTTYNVTGASDLTRVITAALTPAAAAAGGNMFAVMGP